MAVPSGRIFGENQARRYRSFIETIGSPEADAALLRWPSTWINIHSMVVIHSSRARVVVCLPRLRVGLGLLLAIVLIAFPGSHSPPSLSARLTDVAGAHSFDLTRWEAQTLTRRLVEFVDGKARPGTSAQVRDYARLSALADQARRARDQAWAKREVTGAAPELPTAQARLDRLEGQIAALRPVVEATVSTQVEEELRRENIRDGLITWRESATFPFVRPSFAPNVFFQLGPLPQLLVVAPPDEIRIVDSVLLNPNLSPTQIDHIENGADSLGVTSVVTGIGGLAAYPSMLPDSASPHDLIITVAHEWTHHYLAFRPLGMRYFQSYDMTEINETVADMVGHEVGDAAYRRDYPPLPSSTTPRTNPSSTPARPDFWTLMRRIRRNVEGYLSRHDVAGADAYMADQRRALVKDGYYVPRLNTAYLAFFGSYSGSANPYEAKLKLLRERSGSLRNFLETVSTIQQPSDLDRLLAGPSAH